MNFDAKASHRKSRAPWQSSSNNNKISNPYADANTSVVSNSENNDGLQVPNPYGVNNKSNRKNTRRLSIHASAAAAGHGRGPFDSTNLPPVPQLYKTNTQSSDAVLAISRGQDEEEVNIEAKIFGELANGTATEIDDYYKVLVKQKALINRDMKSNINQNQKNILELTNDLKETQEELMQLRITTKELYEVLDEFKEAAHRRMELEHEESEPSRNSLYAELQHKKRKDRSSVMVLGKMWVSELQSLCKHVDGASKYVQPLPGRHVLTESGRWYEVNVGTWKPTKPIHLFMLNDLVLIATKKNSMAQDSRDKKTARLQAIHCWPLHDVKLSEVRMPSNSNKTDKDGNKLYVINIKSKSLSYVYQTDRYDHFLKVTEAYNKGRNELLNKEKIVNSKSVGQNSDLLETDEEKRQLRESLRNSGISDGATDETTKRKSGSQRHSADILLQDISARVHSRNRSHDFDHGPNGTSRFNPSDKGLFFNDLKKIEDRLDEVDIEISRNKYTESVGLIRYIENKLSSIEQAISSNSANTVVSVDEIKLLIDVIKLKINNRKSKIQQCLGFDLHHNIGKLTSAEISTIIEFFHNFEQLDKGISLYLQAMSSNLSVTVSRLMIGVQGSSKIDVVNYLSNLVIIYVSIIKRAISVYKECIFPILKKDPNGNVDSSGLINWSIDEVTKLVATIKKHLYGSLVVLTSSGEETEESTYKVKDVTLFQEFIGVVEPQLNTLKGVGVNVEFLFDDILSLK